MSDVKLCECGCGEPAPIATDTKRERGHVKGEPMRFICGHNIPVPRKLSAQQIRSAYTLYMYGLSVRQLAAQSWQKLGFVNARACENALYRAFWAERRRLRTTSEALRVRHKGRGCAGCDCPLSERTAACQVCNCRHQRWCEQGRPYKPALHRSRCKTCRCPFDLRTPGCRACAMRHWRRARSSLRRNELGGATPAVPARESAPVAGGGKFVPKAPPAPLLAGGVPPLERSAAA